MKHKHWNLDMKNMSVGQKLVRSRSEVGQKLVRSWSEVGQGWPEVGQKSVRRWSGLGHLFVRSWSQVGRKLVRSWPEVGQKLVRRSSEVGHKVFMASEYSWFVRLPSKVVLKLASCKVVYGIPICTCQLVWILKSLIRFGFWIRSAGIRNLNPVSLMCMQGGWNSSVFEVWYVEKQLVRF